jgi:thiol-disulfide isomerase/thioredoxin
LLKTLNCMKIPFAEFYLPLFASILLFASCSNAQGPGEQTARENPPAAVEEIKPRMVGHIPVYENYSAIEPLFRKQTDTTYVINFWATWCKPCIEEMPYFERLHEEFKNQKVQILLVSLDFPKQLESRLLPFVEQRKLKPRVAALTDPDFNNWIDKVSPEWTGAIPATVFYNSKERKFFGEQFADYEELEAIVKSML